MTPRLARRGRVALGVAAVAAIAALPAAANPPLAEKRAQAARVLAEVDALDHEVGKAAEAYNAANLRLQQTTRALDENARLLRLARRNLTRAQAAVARRVVQLYVEGDAPTVAEVMLGAGDLEEVFAGLDARERIVEQDAAIAREVRRVGDAVRAHRAQLLVEQVQAKRFAAGKAEARRRVETQLRERERLLATIQDEVARLREQERVEQARLARQVSARLAAEQAARRAQTDPVAGSSQANGPSPAAPPSEGESAPQPGSAPPARYGNVVAIAMRYLGVPYTWGGASPATGFDCSGFTLYVYAQIGVTLPHYTGAQWQMGTAVSRDELQPGDLVFFNNLGHEGIYIGGNQMIHAPRTGDVVKISSLTGWYDESYYGARRL